MPGMGDFIGGVLHPVVTPSHFLLLLGLGLLAGRRSPPPMKLSMGLFLPLSALALASTAAGWVKGVHPTLLHGLILVTGAVLALDKLPTPSGAAVVFGMAALVLGFDSGVETGASGSVLKTLLGTWLSLAVLSYDAAILAALAAGRRWWPVARRITGAWLVAIALMMLAFALRPPPAPGPGPTP